MRDSKKKRKPREIAIQATREFDRAFDQPKTPNQGKLRKMNEARSHFDIGEMRAQVKKWMKPHRNKV